MLPSCHLAIHYPPHRRNTCHLHTSYPRLTACHFPTLPLHTHRSCLSHGHHTLRTTQDSIRMYQQCHTHHPSYPHNQMSICFPRSPCMPASLRTRLQTVLYLDHPCMQANPTLAPIYTIRSSSIGSSARYALPNTSVYLCVCVHAEYEGLKLRGSCADMAGAP